MSPARSHCGQLHLNPIAENLEASTEISPYSYPSQEVRGLM